MRSVICRILFPAIVVEALARSVGWIVDVFLVDKGLVAECRVRALFLGIKYGYQARDIGRGVTISKPNWLQLSAGTSLRHGVVVMCGKKGVSLGEGTHISHNSVVAGSGGLTIGRDCGISSGVIIYTVDHDHSNGLPLAQCPERHAPVVIGDGVHIGANVTILPGVTIKSDAIVGAGAVVTRDVAEKEVVAGVPARVISVG